MAKAKNHTDIIDSVTLGNIEVIHKTVLAITFLCNRAHNVTDDLFSKKFD